VLPRPDRRCRGAKGNGANPRDLGRTDVTPETRIELVENHATFAALGFHIADKTAHPGYDRATSITMTRPLGGTGWVGGRPAKGADREEPTT